MDNQSKSLVDRWATTVNCGELKEVLDLYSPTASFFPTFLEELNSQSGREEYFRNLKNKEEFRVDINSEKIQFMTKSIHLSYGTYTFFYREKNLLIKYPSRYTFIYDISRDKPIVHHHSSVVP